MKTLLSQLTVITSASLLGFLLSLSACGGSNDPIGEGSQPITEGDDPGDDGESSSEAGSGNATCELGVPQAEAEDCQVVANGLCFSSAEAACACKGCAVEQCAIAESFPLQAFCPSDAPGSSDPDEPVSDDPDGPVSNDGESTSGSCDGSHGGGSDPNPGGDACAAGTPRDSGAACDFVVGDRCFTSGEVACACAGCAQSACMVLESYPAQIRCAAAE